MIKQYLDRHRRIASGRLLAGRGRLLAHTDEVMSDSGVRTGAVAGCRGQEAADDSGHEVANDRGQSVAEIATDLVISAVVLSTLVLLVSWVSQVFAGSATGGILETVRPERTVQRELARLADRMLVVRKCVNPNVHIPGETRLSQCLQFEDTAKYPSPQNPPGIWKYTETQKQWTRVSNSKTWYTTGDVNDVSNISEEAKKEIDDATDALDQFPQPSNSVSAAAGLLKPLCWVTLREDTENTATSDGAPDSKNNNSDQRVLECWYLEKKSSSSTAQGGDGSSSNLYELNIGFHKPAKTVSKTDALKTDTPGIPRPPYNIGYEPTTPVDGSKVTQETSDILEPLWEFKPYRTLTLTDRVMISATVAADQTTDNQQDWQCTILKGNNVVETRACNDHLPGDPPAPNELAPNELPFLPEDPATSYPTTRHERGVIALSLDLCIAFTENELERGLGSLSAEQPTDTNPNDETRCDGALSYLVKLYASPGRE